MKAAAIGAWLLGLALIAALIAWHGAAEVTAAIALAGWGIAAIGLAHLGTLLADTLGWQTLLRRSGRPSLRVLMLQRWICSSINGLLPVAQIGGDLARARLLARSGVGGAAAGASVVVDLTAGLMTQIGFATTGVLLLAHHLSTQGADLGGAVELAGALVLLGFLLAGFGVSQRYGLFLQLARVTHRVAGDRFRAQLAGSAAALDAEIRDRYRRWWGVLACGAWRLLGWLLGSVEIWLAGRALGMPIRMVDAVVLESLGQAVRSAGFFVPGGLGVQEGGILIGGMALGLTPELVLATALLKRARELLYGIPGLLAWSWIDARKLRRADRPRPGH